MTISEVPREVLLQAARAEKCRRSFYYFFCHFWPEFNSSPFSSNWHIQFLCDELQESYNRFSRGEQAKNIVINVPPGTSKSSIVTVAFPIFLWLQDPKLKVISASYSSQISIGHSVKSRDIVRSDKFKLYFPDISIKRDLDNKSFYENNHMGCRFTTSVGGSATGMHGDYLLIDDGLSAEGAASDTMRETANRFVSETLSTRKVNKHTAVTIVVMQRLHTDDITGYLLSKNSEAVKDGSSNNLIHICLPGEISQDLKPAYLSNQYINGVLDNNRLSQSVLEQLKTDLGSYGFAGQIQQRPSPLQDGIWSKDYFVLVEDHLFPKPEELTGYATDWDLAFSGPDKKSNSASAFITSGKINGKLYIDALGFKHCQFPELMAFMQAQVAPHHIESKASGKSAQQTLVSLGIPAIEFMLGTGDKIARASLATPFAEAGLVYIRKSIAEKLFHDPAQGILYFPNGSHDDLCDVLAQAITRNLKKRPTWLVIT